MIERVTLPLTFISLFYHLLSPSYRCLYKTWAALEMNIQRISGDGFAPTCLNISMTNIQMSRVFRLFLSWSFCFCRCSKGFKKKILSFCSFVCLSVCSLRWKQVWNGRVSNVVVVLFNHPKKATIVFYLSFFHSFTTSLKHSYTRNTHTSTPKIQKIK